MNYTLRYTHPTDTLVHAWDSVTTVDASAFIGKFTSDRLKAFKSRFSPSNQSVGQKLGNLATTLGIYGVVAVAFRELSTLDVAPLLHVLHLNGV